jgi:hypothetical protein
MLLVRRVAPETWIVHESISIVSVIKQFMLGETTSFRLFGHALTVNSIVNRWLMLRRGGEFVFPRLLVYALRVHGAFFGHSPTHRPSAGDASVGAQDQG